MADPVSWFLIRPRWKVVASNGADVGSVEEVAGDENADIFDGLAVATSTFGKPRYVPAEQIAAIEEGVVRLALTEDEVDELAEYSRPLG
jgi:hypothetical protein